MGQLTTDLLVTTLGLVRIGYMNDDSLLPMVGNDPYTEGTDGLSDRCRLCTSVEGEAEMNTIQYLIQTSQESHILFG